MIRIGCCMMVGSDWPNFFVSQSFLWQTVCRASIRIYLNLLILNTVCRYFGLSLCKKGRLTFCTVLMLFCVSLFGAAFNAPFVVWENLIFAIVPKVRNQLFKLGFHFFFSTVFRVLFFAAVLLWVSTCISLFFFFFLMLLFCWPKEFRIILALYINSNQHHLLSPFLVFLFCRVCIVAGLNCCQGSNVFNMIVNEYNSVANCVMMRRIIE